MSGNFADPTIQGFLASKDVVVLATVHKNGAPLAMPMWFWADTAQLYMLSVDATQKVRNLRRDGRVCVVAESGTRGAEIRGVTVQGHVEFLERPEVYEPIVAQLLRKYDPHLAALWGGTAKPANRVIFRIVPDKVHSWGFGGGGV
jgi:nitroimidazol reductase NimA-like FMN-containing flavoprotein (pyridoxamine 5'-phosphate oxidase superfamily)